MIRKLRSWWKYSVCRLDRVVLLDQPMYTAKMDTTDPPHSWTRFMDAFPLLRGSCERSLQVLLYSHSPLPISSYFRGRRMAVNR